MTAFATTYYCYFPPFPPFVTAREENEIIQCNAEGLLIRGAAREKKEEEQQAVIGQVCQQGCKCIKVEKKFPTDVLFQPFPPRKKVVELQTKGDAEYFAVQK